MCHGRPKARDVSGYAAFIAAKRRAVHPSGPTLDAGDIHPFLHNWQAEGVAWAARVGRAALFWDCGMGKTIAQVEWARQCADTTLIVAPLSVAQQTVREAARIDVEARFLRSLHDDPATAILDGPQPRAAVRP